MLIAENKHWMENIDERSISKDELEPSNIDNWTGLNYNELKVGH